MKRKVSVVQATDAEVLRASVHRYFKYNQPDLLYMLPYEPMYAATIENMEEDGWQVALHVNEGGKLIYSISAKPIPVLPVFKSNKR
ncbi:hypothetical protein ACS126_13085 [Sphingobacterium lactis]|uniref:hypothetical protein n=1 Tax=Sphingobacterium lactis TaxID=797291 RepID=UPI003EC8327B